MRYLITGTQMKKVDSDTIEKIGIPSMVLMERAALAVAEIVLEQWTEGDHVWVVCGCGNNGADGVAVARMLWMKHCDVTLITMEKEGKGTEEYLKQLSIAKNLNVPIFEYEEFIPGDCDILVDALFGVGMSRPMSGHYTEIVEFLKGQKLKYVVAVDIPSGVDANSGNLFGTSVITANTTVTFGYEKIGTALYPGKEYSGKVIVADIGFPEVPTGYYSYTREDLKCLPVRKSHSNKGTYGKVLIVAGSAGMCGAACLSAKAAYRTGAGIVKILTVEENRTILQTLLPEAIIQTYTPELMENQPEIFQQMLEKECSWASVIVLGPGLGREDYVTKLVEGVLTLAYVPIILDADGLNAVAVHPYLTKYFTENIVATPHIGEMSRLTGKSIPEIQNSLLETALDYSGIHGITCVLKDAATIVASKEHDTYINSSGHACLSKAGTGDVLTGIIAGILAIGAEEGIDEYQAATLGVYLHGLTGEYAAKQVSAHSILAGELADYIKYVMK